MSDDNLAEMSDKKLLLEEWKAALENARSFNTLLLQLRGFGIPIVITIMGGGVAFASKIDIPTIPVKYASIILICIALFLLVLLIAIYVAAKTKKRSGGTDLTLLEICEGAILWFVPVCGWGYSRWFYSQDLYGNAFTVSSPGVIGTLLFALSLLFGLYGIDRCYYYRLLIGAVSRAGKLEDLLGFSLTKTISDVTPLNHSKNVITTVYWLPALGALIAVMFLGYLNLWTGHRVKRDYKIGSAAEAVERAKSDLPKDASSVQVIKVELIKGVNESPPDGQVWHVQLQYETLMATPASDEGKATSSTGRSRKPVRPLRRTSVRQPVVPQSQSTMSNFFLDAKTGETMKVP
jgi:hypothetical protein